MSNSQETAAEHSTVPFRTHSCTIIPGKRTNHESEIPVKTRVSQSRRRLLLSAVVLFVFSSFISAFVSGAVAQTNPAPAPTVPAPALPSLDQIQSQAELDRTITALDAALFDAYNRCDLVK